MKLKLINNGNNQYLATEHGETIENASIINSQLVNNTQHNFRFVNGEMIENNIVTLPQLILTIKLDGEIDTIPSNINGTIIETTLQALPETTKNEVEQ